MLTKTHSSPSCVLASRGERRNSWQQKGKIGETFKKAIFQPHTFTSIVFEAKFMCLFNYPQQDNDDHLAGLGEYVRRTFYRARREDSWNYLDNVPRTCSSTYLANLTFGAFAKQG